MNTRGAAWMAHPAATIVEDTQFATGLGVQHDHVVAVPAGVKVRATPTVLLVNRQGTILGAWEGVGKIESQAAILAAINVGRPLARYQPFGFPFVCSSSHACRGLK